MTADLTFHVEWLDAPGVTDVVDAALWGRLEVAATTWTGARLSLTELRPAGSGTTRRGVYGSIFPLARWLAQSYWSFLWEISPVPRPIAGRELGQIPGLRPWVRRHCLLAAREGFALPDLTLAADGDDVVLSLFPDPPDRPVAFLATVPTFHIPRRRVISALRELMTSVVDRLHGVTHPEATALIRDWHAIENADPDEASLCVTAARLGLDPYDADVMTPEVETALRRSWVILPDGLRTDLLDAAHGFDEFHRATSWVESGGISREGLEPALALPFGPPLTPFATSSGSTCSEALPSEPRHPRSSTRWCSEPGAASQRSWPEPSYRRMFRVSAPQGRYTSGNSATCATAPAR